MIIIAVGLMILVAGCSAALIRSGQDSRRASRDERADAFLEDLICLLGSGAVSISILESEPDSFKDLLDNRSARVVVNTMHDTGTTVYIPNRDAFEDGGDQSTSSRTVAVSFDDGRIIPGVLEVTLRE